MENWQFLIQKQGDRAWRTLESPIVEIIEGKYRVVACSNLANIDVEVRVTHASTLEVPPKRRIQKRSRRTNIEGLIAVIPFTYLKPGIWELQCSGDLMSDLLGKSWQYSVYLQVVPNLSLGEVRKWRPGDQGTRGHGELFLSPTYPNPKGDSKPLISPSRDEVIIDEPVSPVWLKAQTAEQILQNLIELALPLSEPLLENETKVEDSPPAIPDLPLLLMLEAETYVARWGQTLTIHGLVKPNQTNQVLDETSDFERVYAGELRIELCSPDGSKRLTQVRQPLPEQLLPFTIQCSIEIPSDCKSKLVLADINLFGVFADAGVAKLLAHHSFTITADVTELLAISAAVKESEPDILDDPQEQPASPVPLKLELFNIVKTIKTTQPLRLKTSPKNSLPPQIFPRDLHKTLASPQLPKLPQIKIKTMSVTSVVSTSTQWHRLENDNAIAAINRVTSIGTTFPYLRRIVALPDHREDASFQKMSLDSQYMEATEARYEAPHELIAPDAQSDKDSFAEVVVPPSSEFTTPANPRLSPLIKKWMHSQGYSPPVEELGEVAEVRVVEEVREVEEDRVVGDVGNVGDVEDVRQVEEEREAISSSSSSYPPTPHYPFCPLSPEGAPSSPLPLIPRGGPEFPIAHSRQLAQEIVVDDTYIEAKADAFKNYPSKQEEQSISDLPALTEPLPVPQLHLPEGELISGKSVWVNVQLTEKRPQVAVKLWVEDCQTRWLLDGPHLLTDLLPNSLGVLEVITHINVPFGCLEIRLEAIAVDLATQQESHKVTVQRTVIPPDLPNLPLDELLLSI